MYLRKTKGFTIYMIVNVILMESWSIQSEFDNLREPFDSRTDRNKVNNSPQEKCITSADSVVAQRQICKAEK